MIKRSLILLMSLVALTGLPGCEHSFASVSTTQDPKYPVGKQSKIAFPEYKESPAIDLPSRLAGGTLDEQMRAMGFNIVPLDQADFLLGFKVVEKDVPMTTTISVPTINNGFGDINGHPMTSTFFGNTEVPETRMVNMTDLSVTLENTHDPKLTVWQGSISVETSDAQKYRVPFFRALLDHIGETSHGYAQLDAENPPAK